MRVLVTGGAGYVGTELTRSLVRREDIEEIIIYDNLSRRNNNLFLVTPLERRTNGLNIRFVRGELLDSRALADVLRGIDVVYHLAARVTTPFADEDFHGFDQVNHWGTAELSYLLETHPVSRVVYLSTTSVYGAIKGETTIEMTPAPRTTYGLSKYQGERMLERLAGNLALYVFRSGSVYGYSPSMRFDAVVNRFVFEAHFSGRIAVHGSGKQHRPLIHVDNVVRALQASLDGLPAGVYNLVERNLSILEVASYTRQLYPELELLFIQQDVSLRDFRVRTDPRLDGVLDGRSFEDQLRGLREQFSF